MQFLSWVFVCSVDGCREHLLALTDDEVDAYIFLGQIGWRATSRNGGRQHYCPAHASKAET